MPARRAITILVFALLASAPRLAPAQDLGFYSQRIDNVARELIQTIRPTLDPQAQKVLDDIVVEAPASWETNAEARRPYPHRRVVEFNAGLLAVTDWLALAMIAEWAGHDGCFVEYSDYLAGLVDHNSRRMKRGKDRKHVHDFDSYAASTRGQCEGALATTLDPDSWQQYRERMLEGVAVTVLLHEIAHHVLDHVGGQGESALARRVLEMDADRWATRTAVVANYEPRTAVPLFLFLAATGGGTLEDEIRSSSHPSGLERMRRLLVQTRALLDETDPVNARLLDTSIDDLNRAIR